MRLTEMPPQIASVVRDGSFAGLGFITHHTADMLVFIEDHKYLSALLAAENVTCVITTPELMANIPDHFGCAVSESPRMSFYQFHNYLATETSFYWQEFGTSIDPTATIHPRAYVAEKNVRIGAGTIIEAGVNVLERSIIGANVILRAGVTIGSQGFEFKRISGGILPVAHAGGVQIGDRVEIQANSAISRSVFGGYTTIGADTKLDNLVHVAHNVSIGQRCLLAAHAMIAGSTTIGDDVWIGPSAAISSEISIGNGASITLGSVVVRDVPAGQRVTGHFAVDHGVFMRFMRWLRKQ